MTNPHHHPPPAPPQFLQLQHPVQFPQNAYTPHTPHHHYPPSQLSPRNSHPELKLKPHATHNYTTSSASSIQRSPSLSTRSSFSNGSTPLVAKRNSFSDSVAIPTPSAHSPLLNNEQIIDLMEREQDAIVLKLMKEIEALKQENKTLKTNGGSLSLASSGSGSTMVRRSSSLSSNHRNSISSISSGTSSNQPAATGPGSNKRNSALFSNYSVAASSNSDEMYKKFKSTLIDSVEPRDPSPTSRQKARSRNSSIMPYDQVCEENKHLRLELARLRQEIDALKRYKDN
ncbi:uncharacterized protein CANTADRAFT_7708 [Suhomyces tanzawaensis NRRL Y-17324]|uniref:Uncharacterized protein n=1 Tax=Suhomyces tanzawaensis NRRL Y-17324 TaxID=984487 RepID=A0A1E4SCH6_9ASCO|nr:uncharacterized protein CANTADRAFT_7708 [Suhomyces tanzawaensis NRRL Y-17324]ODV77214.1 hypothetical protein CANTADRAFT_7708 [Suhomyces tanzawaensis NRRL Y-17324]